MLQFALQNFLMNDRHILNIDKLVSFVGNLVIFISKAAWGQETDATMEQQLVRRLYSLRLRLVV